MATTWASHEPRAEAGLTSAVIRQLNAYLGDHSGQLAHAAEHAVAAAGKLLRPRLILEACRAVGGDADAALPAAVGTELGHIASLVHDDIIDGDNTRRGRAAVHSAFGVPVAILTGDLLVFQMFAAYAECAANGTGVERVIRAIQILSHTCIDVCRGQALEAELAGALDITEEMYYEMVRLKTAGVCRAAAEIGAVLGGGDSQSIRALRAYGEALGMAFQIIDDVLEYAGDGKKLGKPLDSDLRNHRITLPLIYALNDGHDCRAALLAVLANADNSHASLARLLRQQGAISRAHRTAENFTRVARRHLHLLPPSEARDHLMSLTATLLDRDH